MGVAEIINLDTLEVRVRVTFVRLVDQLNYVLAGTLRKKVKAKIGILSALVLAVALCSVSVAAGQTSVSISFNGSYSAVSCIGPEGCVGAGLYGGTINGVNVGAGQAVHGMICDDYFDNITAGQTWNANGVNAASLTSSNIGSLTMFGATIGVAGYTEVAYLANLMLTSSGLTSTQQGAISEAIWFITSGGKSGALVSSTALGYLNAALAACKGGSISLNQYANLFVYLPNPLGKGQPQEMWSLVSVPEGGAVLSYLFLAGLCCFGAIFLRSRRQVGSMRSPA